MTIGRWSADDGSPSLRFLKSRAGAIGTLHADSRVDTAGDGLGYIGFYTDDGSTDTQANAYGHQAAQIKAELDLATTETNNVPGRLIFSTTADDANSVTERMRINSAGYVGIGTGTLDPDLGDADKSLTLHNPAANAPSLNIGNVSTANGHYVGTLNFYTTTNTSSSANKFVGRIQAELEGTDADSLGGHLKFFTKIDGGAIAERLRITHEGTLDLLNGDFDNIGNASNYMTGHSWVLSNDYDNNTNTLTVSNTSTASSANQAVVRIGIADASTGDPYMNFNIASDADWALGVDHGNSDRFAISRTHYLDGTNDAVRWALSDGEMTLTIAHDNSTYFDYVCDGCGRAEIESFECCGTVAWHDDVLALKEMALNRDGLEHMAKLGVMSITHDGGDGAEWIGINVQTAQHFTWSAMHQMYDRINELETKLEALGV